MLLGLLDLDVGLMGFRLGFGKLLAIFLQVFLDLLPGLLHIDVGVVGVVLRLRYLEPGFGHLALGLDGSAFIKVIELGAHYLLLIVQRLFAAAEWFVKITWELLSRLRFEYDSYRRADRHAEY